MRRTQMTRLVWVIAAVIVAASLVFAAIRH
jgi:hypothetical protein